MLDSKPFTADRLGEPYTLQGAQLSRDICGSTDLSGGQVPRIGAAGGFKSS